MDSGGHYYHDMGLETQCLISNADSNPLPHLNATQDILLMVELLFICFNLRVKSTLFCNIVYLKLTLLT